VDRVLDDVPLRFATVAAALHAMNGADAIAVGADFRGRTFPNGAVSASSDALVASKTTNARFRHTR
jgi:hypothetical protein